MVRKIRHGHGRRIIIEDLPILIIGIIKTRTTIHKKGSIDRVIKIIKIFIYQTVTAISDVLTTERCGRSRGDHFF